MMFTLVAVIGVVLSTGVTDIVEYKPYQHNRFATEADCKGFFLTDAGALAKRELDSVIHAEYPDLTTEVHVKCLPYVNVPD